jgi:hydroxymethylbilane synthase
MLTVSAERAFLKRLEGGCQVPIGGHATLEDDELVLRGMVADLSGQRLIRRGLMGKPGDAEDIGAQLAETILESGGEEILEEIYGSQ